MMALVAMQHVCGIKGGCASVLPGVRTRLPCWPVFRWVCVLNVISCSLQPATLNGAGAGLIAATCHRHPPYCSVLHRCPHPHTSRRLKAAGWGGLHGMSGRACPAGAGVPWQAPVPRPGVLLGPRPSMLLPHRDTAGPPRAIVLFLCVQLGQHLHVSYCGKARICLLLRTHCQAPASRRTLRRWAGWWAQLQTSHAVSTPGDWASPHSSTTPLRHRCCS